MEKHLLILTTTNDFLPKFEQENVKILQQMGYVIHYVTNRFEPHYRSDDERVRKMGVHLHHIEIARSPYLIHDNQKALRQLLGLIHKYHIDVIHCHTPVGGLLGRLAGKLCRDRRPYVVYTAHGFHFYKGAPLFNRLLYFGVEEALARRSDVMIVINEEDSRSAQKFRLKHGGRLYKIPGAGLDRSVFKPLPDEKRDALRARLGIEQDDFFLVSVGELNENKNQKAALEALAKRKRTNKGLPKIKYGICGDGFYRNRMERWILEMGLKETVTLYGYCSNVPEILGCADASIFPSKREGLGMAGLESLAMGVPVIASDNRGTREYMEHGKNGYVCRYDDIDGFERGIEAMKSLSPEKKAAMKIHCIDSAKPFDKRYTTAMMQRIYSSLDQRLEREAYEKASGNQHYHGCI